MKFTFAVKPHPKGRPRFSRFGAVYTPEDTKNFENLIKILAKTQWKNPPLPGALMVNIWFTFERPKSVSRTFPSVKPDLDNLEKSLLDALNGIAYEDDSQICIKNSCKQYGPNAEIIVELTSLDDIE